MFSQSVGLIWYRYLNLGPTTRYPSKQHLPAGPTSRWLRTGKTLASRESTITFMDLTVSSTPSVGLLMPPFTKENTVSYNDVIIITAFVLIRRRRRRRRNSLQEWNLGLRGESQEFEKFGFHTTNPRHFDGILREVGHAITRNDKIQLRVTTNAYYNRVRWG